jgi:hypothetical protein
MNLTYPITMYSNFTDPPPDYEPLQGEIVPLEDEDFIAAHRMGQRRITSNPLRQQWSIYLHYLALQAFQRWFGQRTTTTTIDDAQSIILLPDSSAGQAALCQLNANPFRLCLLVTDGSSENWHIPKATVKEPHLAAHFYFAIVIHEESAQAEILGFLCHGDIAETALAQDTYELTLNALNPNLDTFLLYLSCLDPRAIPLPIAPSPRTNLRQILIQPVISTGQWLSQQLDTLSEAISWQLLPPWEMAIATRNTRQNASQDVASDPMTTLSEILINLTRGGMTLAIDHRPAYRDIRLGLLNLRLYVITAPEETPQPEWSLLVILCQQDGSDLPEGISLQIQDAMQQLVDRQMDTNVFDYLYAKVSGEQTEQFTVTLDYQTESLTLPPFAFQ